MPTASSAQWPHHRGGTFCPRLWPGPFKVNHTFCFYFCRNPLVVVLSAFSTCVAPHNATISAIHKNRTMSRANGSTTSLSMSSASSPRMRHKRRRHKARVSAASGVVSESSWWTLGGGGTPPCAPHAAFITRMASM